LRLLKTGKDMPDKGASNKKAKSQEGKKAPLKGACCLSGAMRLIYKLLVPAART
jgi:hypothetical protein